MFPDDAEQDEVPRFETNRGIGDFNPPDAFVDWYSTNFLVSAISVTRNLGL